MRRSLVAAFIATACLAAPAAAMTADRTPDEVCGAVPDGVQCGAGLGRQTAGGGEKVSHKGWPAVTGVLWKVLDSADHGKVGGPDNDELLGHHGSDVVGGAGNDWLYPSHGRNTVEGGPGRDYIWAFYGHGVIDCGPGRDTVRVRMNGAYRLRGCEVVNHFCAFGSNGHGGCLRP